MICVRIACTPAQYWITYFTDCDRTCPDGGGGWCGIGPSSILSSQHWANVGPAGIAVWVMTKGWPRDSVWVALSIWTSMIIIISVKIIIIIIVKCHSPISNHWLVCFKLSSALSTLWAQHYSGGRKSNHILYAIPKELFTVTSHRAVDKYFLLQCPSALQNTCLHVCLYAMYVEPIDFLWQWTLEYETESQINVDCFVDVWTISCPLKSNTPLLKCSNNDVILLLFCTILYFLYPKNEMFTVV